MSSLSNQANEHLLKNSSAKSDHHKHLPQAPSINWRQIIILLFSLGFVVLIDALSQSDIREFASDIIKNLQKQNLDFYWQFSSFFGETAILMSITAFIYYIFNEEFGMKLFYLLSLSSILNNWLKMIFMYPRPYWYTPDIIAKECTNTCAMPSGHAMNSFILYYTLCQYVIHYIKKRHGTYSQIEINGQQYVEYVQHLSIKDKLYKLLTHSLTII